VVAAREPRPAVFAHDAAAVVERVDHFVAGLVRPGHEDVLRAAIVEALRRLLERRAARAKAMAENMMQNPLPGVPLVESPFFDRLVKSLPPQAAASSHHRDR
jgi:hypothetical protein